MGFTAKPDFTFKHANAVDEPVYLTTALLKTDLDSQSVELRTYINSTLIPELEASAASAKLGAVVNGSASNLQAFITAVEAAGSGSTPGAGIVTDAMMATDVKIGSLAALTTTAKDSIVNAIKELVTASLVDRTPTGVIRMWSGTIANIPTGNVLCDGNNGTPDLRNKFIMGAPDQAGMNATGGNNNTTLTTTQLPAHTHTGTTGVESATHTHSYGTYSSSDAGAGGSGAVPKTGTTGTSGNASATHTHSFTTASSGTGSAYDSRPAYYALAFIMRQ